MVDEYLFLLIRWFHTIAAVAWVGGGIFYWVILKPLTSMGKIDKELTKVLSVEFSKLVKLAIWVLVITGGILLTTRLAQETASIEYVFVLAVKLTLAFIMFFLVFSPGAPRYLPQPVNVNQVTGKWVNRISRPLSITFLGLIIFMLSEVLQLIVEKGLIN